MIRFVCANAVLAGMLIVSDASAVGTCGQTVLFDFSGTDPLPFGGEYIGIFTTEGTVVGGSVDIEFATAGSFDAANVGLSFELYDASHAVGFSFSGAQIGWSGQGVFTLKAPTSSFNGPLQNGGNPWGGMLLVFTNLAPQDGPIQGELTRAVYSLEFGACPIGDITHDLSVNVDDLLAVINQWGPCPAPPASCTADLNRDLSVNVDDLLMVINNWHQWCSNCK